MSTRKIALGKGLNALLPSVEEEAVPDPVNHELGRSKLYAFEDRVRLLGRVADIEVDHIRPNPYQPRKDFDEEALNELAASIEQLGIIQPITVRAMGNGWFEVISGERRLRAARRAGLRRLPAYVREADTEAMLEMALVENVQRSELNPIEVALGYQRLMEECGLTQEQVAVKVSKNRVTVANFLRLLKLPPRVQASLRDSSITVGHARALINIEDEEFQHELLREMLETELTVREVEDRVRAWHRAKHPAEAAPRPVAPAPTAVSDRDTLQLQEMTHRLRTHFSTQVLIRRTKNGSGSIELAFYSNDDLERLLELLVP
jgi:ParB family chromosome partitioning protein